MSPLSVRGFYGPLSNHYSTRAAPANPDLPTQTQTLTPNPTPTPSGDTVQRAECLHAVTMSTDSSVNYCSAAKAKQGFCTANNGTQPVFTGAASDLPCLQGVVDSCGSQLTFGFSGLGGETVSSLGAAFDSGECDAFNLTPTRAEAACWRQGGMDDCIANRFLSEAANQHNPSQALTLDSNCNPASPDDSHDICDDGGIQVNYWPSPISLVWNAQADLNASIRIVRFPLDPAHPEGFYLWKASNDFPLLVFDPSHTGKVTSASQLFGNYTFGKQWKDGYDALASLDANHDGKLSGEELASLALWFDANQNGVSEPGEVQTLAQAGVEEIYLKPSRRDDRSGDIYAEPGYSIRTRGQIAAGASVDWFSKAYDSQMSAVAAFQELASKFEAVSSESKVSTRSPTKNNYKDTVSGAWFWTVGNPDRYSPKGLLTFKQKGEEVSGRSYVEVPLKRNSRELRSELLTTPISGEVTITADGVRRLHFVVKGTNGLETISDAVISPDGRTLDGYSTSSISEGRSNKKLTSLSYNWTATRWDGPRQK